MRKGIEKQIAKADAILTQLKPFGAVVAGGAPRDWYRNVVANDIDVFVAGEPSKEELLEALELKECNLVELGDGDYSGKHQRFVGYSFEDEEGQEFQILCHRKDSVEEIVKNFPNNLSMAIYYGEGKFWYDDWFIVGMDYHVGWFNDESDYRSDIYENKILDKFRGPLWTWFSDKGSILRHIGGNEGPAAELRTWFDDF